MGGGGVTVGYNLKKLVQKLILRSSRKQILLNWFKKYIKTCTTNILQNENVIFTYAIDIF